MWKQQWKNCTSCMFKLFIWTICSLMDHFPASTWRTHCCLQSDSSSHLMNELIYIHSVTVYWLLNFTLCWQDSRLTFDLRVCRAALHLTLKRRVCESVDEDPINRLWRWTNSSSSLYLLWRCFISGPKSINLSFIWPGKQKPPDSKSAADLSSVHSCGNLNP